MHRKPRLDQRLVDRLREVRRQRWQGRAVRAGRWYRTEGHSATLDITGLALISAGMFTIPVVGTTLGLVVGGLAFLAWRLRG